MNRYARMLLHFLHAITNDRDRVHTLVFGTRLTNITRHLRIATSMPRSMPGHALGRRLRGRRHADRRLPCRFQPALVAAAARAECGRAANQRRPRCRHRCEGLAFEVERLAKSCARLIWLNPLLRYAGLEARAAGIARDPAARRQLSCRAQHASLRDISAALDPRRAVSQAPFRQQQHDRDEHRAREKVDRGLSWPFQILDCHIENHSPPTMTKPTK